MINVGVLGANGRMGSEVVKAVSSTQGLALVAALDVGDPLDKLAASSAHVVVDFTNPDSVMGNLEYLIKVSITSSASWPAARAFHKPRLVKR